MRNIFHHFIKLDFVVVASEAEDNLHEIAFVVVQNLRNVITFCNKGGDAGSNRVGHEVVLGRELSNCQERDLKKKKP